jgi:hypothetical protein
MKLRAVLFAVFMFACGRASIETDAGSGGGDASGGGAATGGGGGAATGGGGGDDGGTPVGGPCSSSSDCQFAPGDSIHQYTPVCLPEPEGYCALPCHDGFGCWAGMSCTQNHQCLKSCATDSDCRVSEGYGCCDAGVGSTGLCEPTPCM